MDVNDFLELLGNRVNSRAIDVSAHGDTNDELEMNALDCARAFFGTEVRLEVVPAYKVSYLSSAEPGNKAQGMVTVRMVE